MKLCDNMATFWDSRQIWPKIAMVTIFVVLGFMKGSDCTTLTCSFEANDPCFLHQDTSDTFDWTFPQQGRTGSWNTGPNFAVEGTSYAYIEPSWSENRGGVAILVSNSLPVVETLCLTFAYHMYGHSIGTLNVLVSDDLDRKTNMWTRSGNQGNEWHGTGIQIPPEPSTTKSIKIFFEAIRSSYSWGTTAIDNVVITPGTCIEGTWNSWGPCSVSCGKGSKVRKRTCSYTASHYGGVYCTKPEYTTQRETCSAISCPVNGMWGSWSTWNTCSVTCAVGSKSRTRQCNDPAPAFNGHQCIGEPVDKDTCTLSPCPVNGMWGSWSTWSTCSVTCAVGSKSRTRQCNDPAPAFNGHQCTGEPVDKDTCTLSPCPVNGMWGSWSTWSTCSVTCAVGSKSRTRQCNDPTPAFNGLQCTGEPVDKDTCTLSPCPVNGMWGSWSAWSTCSVTCAVGSKSRTRQCNDPAPALNGLQCTGEPVDKDACTLSPCPVDGGWASWRTWGACSDVNNEVVRAKCRKCINPTPQYGGDFCSGNQLLVEQCPTTPGHLKRKCRCRRSRMPVIKNISLGELADIMDKTKEELTVDKTQTAVAISKKISAPDSRKSSFAMGILGIIMFAVPVAFLIGIDLMNVYQYFKGRNQ